MNGTLIGRSIIAAPHRAASTASRESKVRMIEREIAINSP